MTPRTDVILADCLEWMRQQPDNSVDLVFGSPPYEAARTYGIDFSLKGQDWVDWMVERMREMVRISKGLVAMVVEGQTRKFRWSATPALLMADLHRAGIHLRKPPIFHRVGIPGSGGPDWLRNDYEFIVCCTAGGKLPWSDNTAMGHPPKWAPGGEMSYRVTDGSRVNQWGHPIDSGATQVLEDGCVVSSGKRPSHVDLSRRNVWGLDGSTGNRDRNGNRKPQSNPVLANPGNVIKCNVGGGVMGDPLCHENEAPFPEALAEFFIRSFCPPQGIVYDPFCGSGTTAAVAVKCGRNAVTTDIRQSQVDLAKRRIDRSSPTLF